MTRHAVNILALDDDLNDLRAMREFLRGMGISNRLESTTTIAQAKAEMERAKSQGWAFDIVILDMNLLGENSEVLAAEVLGEPFPPVIWMLSGAHDLVAEKRLLDIGVFVFMEKPRGGITEEFLQYAIDHTNREFPLLGLKLEQVRAITRERATR